ncbi:MAG: DsbA family protein [Alphaproteobacteria bacterium]|nr:DsbA family protein [Alphaproteobacteria bacterium]
MRFIYLILAFSLLTTSFFAANAQAQEALSKSDVEDIIKDYLMDNPELILDSLDAYRAKQEEMEKASAEESIDKNIDYLTSKNAPSVGPVDADVTVVEFFDYNCGYCRKALPDIQTLAKEDKKVRFVFREMPILSPNSAEVSKWALAAHKQGKYFEMHSALMDQRGTRTADTIKKLAEELGLDVGKLEKDANSDAVKTELEKDMMMAREIGIRGTPAFIIDGQLYPGYLGEDGLKQAIETARKNGDK